MTDHLWFPEVAKALSNSSHLFVYYCAFHRVDQHGETLVAELKEAGYAAAVFRLDTPRLFEPVGDVEVALLVGMESLIEKPRALEQLRVQVNDWASQEAGRRVVIVSRLPRSAFPVGDGSSLVLDSRDVHLHESRFAEWVISEYESTHGPLPPAAESSRGLASALLSESGDRQPDVDKLVSEIACQTFVELGPNYVALLDEWVLERRRRSVPAVDIPEWMQVELIMAGVAQLDLDQQHVLLFNRALGDGWTDGLRTASKRCVAAPRDWRDLAASLFELERLLRRVMAGALEASLGRKWAKQVIPEVQARYIRQAAGVPEEFPLHELANPLDYMTLGQLLDLADLRAEMPGVGLSETLRMELRRAVPIRNRMGHMRLPRMGDLHAARSTLRLLQLKVS